MSSPMTLKALSGVINISLIRRMNHRCMKWCDLNVTHQSCVYPRQDSSDGVPPGGAEPGLAVFFSVPQHQNSLPEHMHTRTPDADNYETLAASIHIISCDSSLIELTPQLRVWFTRFRSKMEDGGRNKC